ncbi:MAG: serine/threonine protein kinase [Thermoanaerobaculaceae bacterium]|nr:serine/threonine protein kinase [Thermoanaerobaculaceae bacterium]
MGMEKEKIGRYEILDKLGQGAMGVVYKARDPNIGRIVALKTMTHSANLPEEQRKEYAKRFFREAQSAGALQHPNIVTIYDMDEDDGIPFIAMEYIEGKSLSKIIEEKGQMPVLEAVSIIKQVAEGLSFAHEKGIVHRDIKPDNILVDRNGRAVVTDFGIAHLEESNLTRTGEVLGTPFCMSPEQILEGKLDRRSDLFSLGVVFYLMLTGRRPFKGETISSICYHIVHTVPDPLPQDSSIPMPLLSILHKLLEKDPDKRYSNGKELISDLEKIQNLTVKQTEETLNAPQKEKAVPQPPPPPKIAPKQTPKVPAPQPVTPEKKKKSSFALIAVLGAFVVVIGLAAILGGGYYLYKKGVLFPPNTETTEQQKENPDVGTKTQPPGDTTIEQKKEDTIPQKQIIPDNPPPVKKEKPQKTEEKPPTKPPEEPKTNDTVTPPPPPPPTETKPAVTPSKIGLIFETKISEISLTFYIDGEEKLREAFVTENGARFSQEFKVAPGQHDIKVVVQATKFPPFIREGSFAINVPEGSNQIIKIEPARKPAPRLTIKKIDSQTGQSSVLMEK